jgi:hypothetical protein
MRRNLIDMPYRHAPNGHHATDYGRWQGLSEASMEYYPTLPYQDRYEPYLVFNHHTTP